MPSTPLAVGDEQPHVLFHGSKRPEPSAPVDRLTAELLRLPEVAVPSSDPWQPVRAIPAGDHPRGSAPLTATS